MVDLEKQNAGNVKVREYLERIKNGESKEDIFKDLPEVFKSAIESELKEAKTKDDKERSDSISVPPQYEGLPSFVVEEIWTIPVYVDNEKTKAELERKRKVLEILKKEENETQQTSEEKIKDGERIEEIRKEFNGLEDGKIEKNENEFKTFSVSNGETDTGVFWYQYRNKKAKDLKASGELETGKERIYFDVKIDDMERLRDLAIGIAGECEIAIEFKHLDEKKTFKSHKDGKETRFVANFASEDDAKNFFLALSKNSEYAALVSDRNLSHGGIRIDSIAEYASGFREGKGALARIMSGKFNAENTIYTYKSEFGRDISIDPSSYKEFKIQYEKILNEMKSKEKEWQKFLV